MVRAISRKAAEGIAMDARLVLEPLVHADVHLGRETMSNCGTNRAATPDSGQEWDKSAVPRVARLCKLLRELVELTGIEPVTS